MSIEKLKIINLVKVEFMAEQCYGVTLDCTDLHNDIIHTMKWPLSVNATSDVSVVLQYSLATL